MVAVACCAVVWLAASLPLSAQDESAPTISKVEFRGIPPASEVFARKLVEARAGGRLNTVELDLAVTRLLRSGRFLRASYSLQEDGDRVKVLFDLRERPVVTEVRFEGNVKFRDGQLKQRVPEMIGSPVDPFVVGEGRDAIIAMYREEGFGAVAVTYDRERLQSTGELLYVIEEGERVRIRRIVFEGAHSFSDRELGRNIESKKAFWIFRTGAFDEERAESDVARLRAFYRDQGFLDARVSYRRELLEDGEGLALIFTIDEWDRYAVEALDFRGNTVFTHEELWGLMRTRVGETVRRPQVDADVSRIHTRYGELGYIYAQVRVIQVFSNTPGLVRITIEINEGDQFRVGRVVVRGNVRTKDKVVRRTLNLYPPDDLFDMTETKKARRKLLETRIFSSARVYPVGDEPGVRDVVMDVEEAEKSGDFIFGAGVTSNSGLVGNIVLDMKNFDLFDTPRSWSELLKFRSFFGAGQHFRLELQPGTVLSRFRIDFTEPYFMDKPLRLDVSAFLFSRGRDGYDERRGGASVSLGKRFERGRLRGWSGELALRIEDVNVRDVDILASSEIRDDEGSTLLTSVKGSLVRDRTDNRLVPTTGGRLRMSYEQFGVLGGDAGYAKVTAGYTWYKTLDTDTHGRKRILQLRAEGGVIVGNAPVFNRFFAGGTGSIRGFEFRGVGERDGIDDNNIGGDFRILGGAEYSFPLIGERIRGLYFLDTAMVGSGTLRASIGAGVRFTINLFGPVPLELSLAFPVIKDSGDETQVFSFQVGTLF